MEHESAVEYAPGRGRDAAQERETGGAAHGRITRYRGAMLLVVLACMWIPAGLVGVQPADTPSLTHGPFLGHAGPDRAWVWARGATAGEYTLVWSRGEEEHRLAARTDESRDGTLRWLVTGLEAGEAVSFDVLHGDELVHTGGRLRAGPEPAASRVRVAFASCANEVRFPVQAGWGRMLEEGAEALFLLGDMPYIDSTELDVQRRRYREFYRVPEIARALTAVPFYATWPLKS